MTDYETYTLIIGAGSALIALVMLGIGLFQMRGLVQQVKQAVEANKISRLNALLGMEDSIVQRRRELGEAGIALVELKKTADEAEWKPAELRFDEAKQMYLNALDRLCFCLLNKVLDEEELRPEYREVVRVAVKDFEPEFGAGTDYRNIKKVHERWADT